MTTSVSRCRSSKRNPRLCAGVFVSDRLQLHLSCTGLSALRSISTSIIVNGCTMENLTAFVGHSFSEADESIVASIIKMLNETKQNLNGKFDFETARNAEAKGIAEKVFEKMEDKDLFIGVCTSRERVIDLSAWTRSISSFGFRFISSKQSEMKASDWVIQESAYALGKGLRVILLIENGVRPIQGLLRDAEYIPFSRENPSSILPSLTSALMNILSGADRRAMKSPEPSKSKSVDIITDNEGYPRRDMDSWDLDDFKEEIREALAVSDHDRLEETLREFKVRKESREAESVYLQSYRLFWEQLFSDKPKIQELKQLVESHPGNGGARFYYALALRSQNEIELYAQELELVKRSEIISEPREDAVFFLIDAYCELKDLDKAKSVLGEARQIAKADSTYISRYSQSVKEVSKLEGLEYLDLAAAEYALINSPSSESIRFDLAYKYSNSVNEKLALFHYKKLVKYRNEDVDWNNLGVSQSSLKLPILSIRSYERSKQLGGTLAVSNLAYSYLDAGFHELAMKECEMAKQLPSCHPRLYEALAAAMKRPDDEREKEKEILEETSEFREFMRNVGAATTRELSVTKKLDFSYKGGEVSFRIEGSKVFVKGRYVRRKALGLAGLLISSDDESKNRSEMVRVDGVGSIFGSAFEMSWKEQVGEEVIGPRTVLGDRSDPKVLGYFSEDLNTIEIWEGTKKNGFSVSELRRNDTDSADGS